MSETFERVKELVVAGRSRMSQHGFGELKKDGMLPDDAIESISTGVVVEDYPDAWKGPTVLVRQTVRTGRHVHVVWGTTAPPFHEAVLVTAYVPEPAEWSADFLSRVRK